MSVTESSHQKKQTHHTGDHTACNIKVTNDEEDSVANDDEFCLPPACKDKEDSMSDGESEASDESKKEARTKNASSKKGKKLKLGHKDVVTMRETTAQKPTAMATEKRLKRQADLDVTRSVLICMSVIHLFSDKQS
jgi:hypothetical protein